MSRVKNRGNYSVFRDKTFIPNASRVAQASINASQDLKEPLANNSSDDNEDDYNSSSDER